MIGERFSRQVAMEPPIRVIIEPLVQQNVEANARDQLPKVLEQASFAEVCCA